MKNDLPRVPAYPRDKHLGQSTGLKMWCCWCDTWHYHGDGYGHRVAHCYDKNSPYNDTGYWLTDPAKLTQKDGRA